MSDKTTATMKQLNIARAAFPHEHVSYRQVLSTHHRAMKIMKHLSDRTGLVAPGGSRPLLTSAVLLYEEATRHSDFPGSVTDHEGNVYVHFLQFAADILPCGSAGTPLRAIILKAIRSWKRRHPGVSAKPSWQLPYAPTPADQTV